MSQPKSKILICDDSLLMRKKLKESILECGNFEILDAADGQSAIDMYKQYKPALIFLDIVMPVKSGIEALSEIRELDNHASVVMVSSTGTQSNLKKALEAGAVGFIQKPWEQSSISSLVQRFIMRGGEENHV